MAWTEYNAPARAADSARRAGKTRGETVLAALLHAVSKQRRRVRNGAAMGHSNEPMRFRLLKFIQMKNARPTMLLSGTKPQ